MRVAPLFAGAAATIAVMGGFFAGGSFTGDCPGRGGSFTGGSSVGEGGSSRGAGGSAGGSSAGGSGSSGGAAGDGCMVKAGGALTPDGRFCAVVAREQFNCELCAPDSSRRREAILAIIRGDAQSNHGQWRGPHPSMCIHSPLFQERPAPGASWPCLGRCPVRR